jgi:glyoxalase family protein
MEFREKILSKGLNITPKINRDYFFSLYFREPGGVLFEIATDNPGFTVDEPLNELGTHLRLPKQYEGMRGELEKSLPVLHG